MYRILLAGADLDRSLLRDHSCFPDANARPVPAGKIKAQVFAKAVIVLGDVTGNITATEKVDIRDGGSVDGDIVSPRVAIAEGAHFRGSVDMQRKGIAQQLHETPAVQRGPVPVQAQQVAAH